MNFVILLNVLSIALGIASISLSVFILRRIAQ